MPISRGMSDFRFTNLFTLLLRDSGLKFTLIKFLIIGLLTSSGGTLSAVAGEFTLENGLKLKGFPESHDSFDEEQGKRFHRYDNPDTLTNEVYHSNRRSILVSVDDEIRKTYVPRKQIQEEQLDNSQELDSRYDTFEISQPLSGKKKLSLKNVTGYLPPTPFDEQGRRTLTLRTRFGDIVLELGITLIHPKYVVVSGLNYDWELRLDPKAIPPEILQSLILKSINLDDPRDLLSVVRFYIDAEMDYAALKLLESDQIKEKFADQQQEFKSYHATVSQQLASTLYHEFERRVAVGQHEKAFESTRSLSQFPPEQVEVGLRQNLQDLMLSYEQGKDRIDAAILAMATLQSELTLPEHRQRANMVRTMIQSELTLDTVERLDSYFQLESDPTLTADEKIALLFSAWVVGSSNAVTDIGLALGLWDARLLVNDYLLNDTESERDSIFTRLQEVEGLGPEELAQIIALLPPLVETPQAVIGVPFQVETMTREQQPASYSVLLPLEYSPHRSYPTIIALNAVSISPENTLKWWGGSYDHPGEALRRGYIVIAPHFHSGGGARFDFSEIAMDQIQASIEDSRKRFAIDADRIFLAGMVDGGDAALEFGLLHPKYFAGVISIRGQFRDLAHHYWRNGKHLGWYFVGGEMDARSSSQLFKMFQSNVNMIYAEYTNRFGETYREELPRLFEWMAVHQRQSARPQLNYAHIQPAEGVELDWLHCSEFKVSSRSKKPTVPVAAKFTAGLKGTDRMEVNRTLAGKHTFWLSPELFDFDRKIQVKVKSKVVHKGYLKPNMRVMLDDYRVRNDRQHLHWARIDY